MKLEETENLELHYVNYIQTTTTQINNTNNSDTDLSEKVNKTLNICEKTQILKVNHHYCRRYGHSIAECRHKKQDNQIN